MGSTSRRSNEHVSHTHEDTMASSRPYPVILAGLLSPVKGLWAEPPHQKSCAPAHSGMLAHTTVSWTARGDPNGVSHDVGPAHPVVAGRDPQRQKCVPRAVSLSGARAA